jgi:hypothetical protein
LLRYAYQIRPQGLAWSLNAGAALVYAHEAPRAVGVLDGAEDLMKGRDVNDFGNTQYEYATYDGVMVNAYKGLAFLGAGDKQQARVEFNRVAERQERAQDEFAKEKAKLDATAAQSARGSFDLRGALQNAQSNHDYQEAQAELGRFANYQPFINPAANYLRAIYLLNSDVPGDVGKARDELIRVRDMAGSSRALQADLALASAGRKPAHPITWVIFENGQSPTFEQYNISFPVPVVAKGGRVEPGLVTIGLPRMVFHPAAAGRLAVSAGKGEALTESIGDFDRVMASEFARRQHAIITRAVVEVALKAALQTAAAQTGNGLVRLVAAAASNITSADTRSWTALPKGFQAARVDAPNDGMLHLRLDNGQDLGPIQVPGNAGSIVYVKALAPGGRPSVQVFPL